MLQKYMNDNKSSTRSQTNKWYQRRLKLIRLSTLLEHFLKTGGFVLHVLAFIRQQQFTGILKLATQ